MISTPFLDIELWVIAFAVCGLLFALLVGLISASIARSTLGGDMTVDPACRKCGKLSGPQKSACGVCGAKLA